MPDTDFPQHLLASLLAAEDHVGETGRFAAGTRWACWDEGVLLLEPAGGARAQFDLLLSCGIHGNETAPIELLDNLLQELADAPLTLNSRVLLIFGNPAAIRSGERYIDDDLNRLFDGKHQNLAASAEAMRAALLEQYAQRFFAMGEGLRLHLDLHTAIRGSYYPTFAICPAQGEVRYIESLFGLLHAAQINTLLLQDQPAATFSSFSRSRCNARSLTLELGQARPLGHNQQLDLHALHAVLRQLFAGTWPWPDAQASDFRLFRVTREIIKSSADFQLNLDDAVLNFTPLPEGSVVAQDGRQQTIAAGGEHIIFPNREVKVGLRAGLLVAQHLPGSG